MAVSYMFQKLLSLHATFLIAGSSFWLCGCLYAQIKHLHSISLSLSPSFPLLLSLSLSDLPEKLCINQIDCKDLYHMHAQTLTHSHTHTHTHTYTPRSV